MQFLFFVLGIFFIKIVLLPWSAHPYDFWTFVNTSERSLFYGWNIFDQWNKGILLIAVWHPLHHWYYFILETFSFLERYDIPILHFIFKLPFLFIDVLSAFLIYKIVFYITKSRFYGKISFLLWYLNPVIFCVYGIHGHYEILTVFSILLILYAIQTKNSLLLSLGLAIGITTKYFIIVFLPFLLIFMVRNRLYGFLIKTIIFSLFLIILSFSHFFFYENIFLQSINSVLHLSQNGGSQDTNISTVSLLGMSSLIANLPLPIPLRNFVIERSFFLAGTCFVVHYLIRTFIAFIKKKSYKTSELFFDIFVSLIYFSVFLNNFQQHYLIWFIPIFLFIFLFGKQSTFSLILFGTFSVVASLLCIKNEIGPGTFFMDIIGGISSPGLNDTSFAYKRNLSWITTGTLLLALYFFFKYKYFLENSIRKVEWRKLLFFLVPIWMLFIILHLVSTFEYFEKRTFPHDLYYSHSNTFHKGIVLGSYASDIFLDGKYIFSEESENKSLLKEGVQNLPEEFFIVKVLVNKESFMLAYPDLDFESLLQTVKLNDCQATDFSYNPEVFYKKNMISLSYEPSCLKDRNNLAWFSSGKKLLQPKNIFLYVQNKPIEVRIRNPIFEFFGGFLFFGFIFGSLAIIRRFYD